jgi:hypothetical protein
MRPEELDDDAVAATEAQLRRARDTLLALVGAGLIALGVLGMHFDVRIGPPATGLMVYGVLLGLGSLLALAGLVMGIAGLVRGRSA